VTRRPEAATGAQPPGPPIAFRLRARRSRHGTAAATGRRPRTRGRTPGSYGGRQEPEGAWGSCGEKWERPAPEARPESAGTGVKTGEEQAGSGSAEAWECPLGEGAGLRFSLGYGRARRGCSAPLRKAGRAGRGSARWGGCTEWVESPPPGGLSVRKARPLGASRAAEALKGAEEPFVSHRCAGPQMRFCG